MSEPLPRIETQTHTSSGRVMTAAEVRDGLLKFLRRDLIGPAHGDTETLEDNPKLHYAAGILFPQDSPRNDSAAVAGVEDDFDQSSGEIGDVSSSEPVPEGEARDTNPQTVDSEYDDLITLANSYRPSAVGLTFMA